MRDRPGEPCRQFPLLSKNSTDYCVGPGARMALLRQSLDLVDK